MHHRFQGTPKTDEMVIATGTEIGGLLCDGLGDGVLIEYPQEDLSFLRVMSFGLLQARLAMQLVFWSDNPFYLPNICVTRNLKCKESEVPAEAATLLRWDLLHDAASFQHALRMAHGLSRRTRCQG